MVVPLGIVLLIALIFIISAVVAQQAQQQRLLHIMWEWEPLNAHTREDPTRTSPTTLPGFRLAPCWRRMIRRDGRMFQAHLWSVHTEAPAQRGSYVVLSAAFPVRFTGAPDDLELFGGLEGALAPAGTAIPVTQQLLSHDCAIHLSFTHQDRHVSLTLLPAEHLSGWIEDWAIAIPERLDLTLRGVFYRDDILHTVWFTPQDLQRGDGRPDHIATTAIDLSAPLWEGLRWLPQDTEAMCALLWGQFVEPPQRVVTERSVHAAALQFSMEGRLNTWSLHALCGLAQLAPEDPEVRKTLVRIIRRGDPVDVFLLYEHAPALVHQLHEDEQVWALARASLDGVTSLLRSAAVINRRALLTRQFALRERTMREVIKKHPVAIDLPAMRALWDAVDGDVAKAELLLHAARRDLGRLPDVLAWPVYPLDPAPTTPDLWHTDTSFTALWRLDRFHPDALGTMLAETGAAARLLIHIQQGIERHTNTLCSARYTDNRWVLIQRDERRAHMRPNVHEPLWCIFPALLLELLPGAEAGRTLTGLHETFAHHHHTARMLDGIIRRRAARASATRGALQLASDAPTRGGISVVDDSRGALSPAPEEG